ncbi:blastula protease 10-like [Tubulanus polymorphus]|uniref:blastula protease 10-like n=1 Tax=Tubulanus polymorphus TaxID=672921 RepID=UPI003DA263E2
MVGVLAHELGHTLGLFHEQTRPDRDDFVTVFSKNIQKGGLDNFVKYDLDSVQDHGVPYDLGSIMHYAGWYFSKNKKPTILAKKSDMQSVMGQRRALSLYDTQIVNIMYKCAVHCKSDIVCQNHGYVGKDCSCVCPEGLTGVTCEDVTGVIQQSMNTENFSTKGFGYAEMSTSLRIADESKTCGGILSNDSGIITTPNYPADYNNNMDCIWLIKNKPGGIIHFEFEDFEMEHEYGCAYDYVEIRHNGPQIFGPRYCGWGPKKTFQLLNDGLLIQFHSDEQDTAKGFQASYKLEQTSKTPVDGGWSQWGMWSGCASQCGMSSKIRKRSCTHPKPNHGGKNCAGLKVSIGQCKLKPC